MTVFCQKTNPPKKSSFPNNLSFNNQSLISPFKCTDLVVFIGNIKFFVFIYNKKGNKTLNKVLFKYSLKELIWKF